MALASPQPADQSPNLRFAICAQGRMFFAHRSATDITIGSNETGTGAHIYIKGRKDLAGPHVRLRYVAPNKLRMWNVAGEYDVPKSLMLMLPGKYACEMPLRSGEPPMVLTLPFEITLCKMRITIDRATLPEPRKDLVMSGPCVAGYRDLYRGMLSLDHTLVVLERCE